jgi:hypothetical protein
VQEISKNVSSIKNISNNRLSEVRPMTEPNQPEHNLSENEADEVPDEDDLLDESGVQSACKVFGNS